MLWLHNSAYNPIMRKTPKNLKEKKEKVVLRKTREKKVQFQYRNHKYQHNNQEKKQNLWQNWG